MDLEPGTVVGNRYVVDGPIGRGGVATVYRVRHVTLDTMHALKVLQHVVGSVQERLVREGKLQGRLGHPNVVAVTDAIDVRGVPALVLELVDGPNLGALLAQRTLTVPQIDVLGAGILAGMAAAHEAGLVHRDLKPANVLVARTRDGLIAKVSDFGLARVLDDDPDGRRTRTGAGLGTPQHMSPEQIRDAKDVDERADVWALGTVLYELATGRPAFDDPDRLALFLAIAEGRYPRVELLRPDLPPRMVKAIGWALSVDRDARPRDASALLAAWAPQTAPDPALWDAETVEVARSLAPSATSRSSGTPRSSDNRTWVEGPPPPAPVRRRSRWPWVAGGAALVAVALIAVLTAPHPDGAIEAPPPPPVPQRTEIAEVADHQTQMLRDAEQLLLDGDPEQASEKVGWVLAMLDDAQAELVSATSSRATGRFGYADEELGKATSAPIGAERAKILFAARARPAALDEWLAAHPDDWVLGWWATVAPFAGRDDRDRALARFAAQVPGRRLVDRTRAMLALDRGDWPAARAALDLCTAAAPDDLHLRLARARLAAGEGQLEAAETELTALVALRGAPVGTARELVRVNIARGTPVDDALRRAGRLPADAQLRTHLGAAQAYAGRGELALARAQFDAAAAVARRYSFDFDLVTVGFERLVVEQWLEAGPSDVALEWIDEGASSIRLAPHDHTNALRLRALARAFTVAGDPAAVRAATAPLSSDADPPPSVLALARRLEQGRPWDLGFTDPLTLPPLEGCAGPCDPLGIGRAKLAAEATDPAELARWWPSPDPELPLARRAGTTRTAAEVH